jgi:hypothetical protein
MTGIEDLPVLNVSAGRAAVCLWHVNLSLMIIVVYSDGSRVDEVRAKTPEIPLPSRYGLGYRRIVDP